MLELSLSTWGMEFDRLPVREGVVIHMLLFTKTKGERGREIWREKEREGESERERERDTSPPGRGRTREVRERERGTGRNREKEEARKE